MASRQHCSWQHSTRSYISLFVQNTQDRMAVFPLHFSWDLIGREGQTREIKNNMNSYSNSDINNNSNDKLNNNSNNSKTELCQNFRGQP